MYMIYTNRSIYNFLSFAQQITKIVILIRRQKVSFQFFFHEYGWPSLDLHDMSRACYWEVTTTKEQKNLAPWGSQSVKTAWPWNVTQSISIKSHPKSMKKHLKFSLCPLDISIIIILYGTMHIYQHMNYYLKLLFTDIYIYIAISHRVHSTHTTLKKKQTCINYLYQLLNCFAMSSYCWEPGPCLMGAHLKIMWARFPLKSCRGT